MVGAWGRTGAARRFVLLCCALALVAVGSGQWRAIPARAAKTQPVDIISSSGTNSYRPSDFTIDPGDTVTWTNRDATAPHNATCGDPRDCPEQFSYQIGGAGSSGSVTFHYSGKYTYHCSAHSDMVGHFTVTGNVQPPPPQSGSAASPAAAHPLGTASSAPSSRAAGSATPARAGSTPGGPVALAGSNATPSVVPGTTMPLVLPRPQVVVQGARTTTTPAWALGAAAVLLIVSAAVFGFAWFRRV
jgi:plastocyanin